MRTDPADDFTPIETVLVLQLFIESMVSPDERFGWDLLELVELRKREQW